jgi:signal transduction histidine kinase
MFSAEELPLEERPSRDERYEALRQSHDRLKVAADARASMLSFMSHELRTPLNAVLGFSDLLLDSPSPPLSPTQHAYVEEIQSAGRHLLTIINGVLDLAKLDAGAMRLELEPVEPELPVRQAEQMVRPLAAKKGISLEVEVGTQARCVADMQRLRQVVVNLLSNAIKFTPEGGRITVRIAQQHDWVLVSVSDTGIGIDPSHHRRVFDEFQQVGNRARGSAEGTGLGLALVKRFVDQMKGTVALTSRLGCGATFTVRLPKPSQDRMKVPARTRLALVRASWRSVHDP